ncbi:Crp/Fnr family transcriptional regulator [Methylobacterium nigriterrae]|uniref:Crp/Fnr family transcriptional regulator n=1 Tax=Methylobacterium nigriterrae TaxID=3127512 RepID=UPI003013E74F
METLPRYAVSPLRSGTQGVMAGRRGAGVSPDSAGEAAGGILARKLGNYVELSAAERDALKELGRQQRHHGAREHLSLENGLSRSVPLILEGNACRYKILPDGRRQILTLFIPGDLCGRCLPDLDLGDESVVTLTSATVAIIPRQAFAALIDEHPRLFRALAYNALVEEAVHREWIVNIGQRTGYERIAHLFCELFVRLSAVGLTQGNRCELPLTQGELADALGLSAVHINRTVQQLRSDGLICLRGRELTILDLPALQSAAMFDGHYLHLPQGKRTIDAGAIGAHPGF